MLKYCLKTIYFRGRGPQRIRKVILFITQVNAQAAPIDDYLAGAGFRDGAATGGIALPSLAALTRAPADPVASPGGHPGQPTPGRMRGVNSNLYTIIRTIEPRFHSVAEIPVPNGVAGANCFLDFAAISENTISGAQRVAIKCYHVPAAGGLLESATIAAPGLPADIPFGIELEYTSNSGAEG